ncbi:hypothetical protein [Rhizobium sp. Leaf341]|uniref:hypothetical protein n=1 Tax=Rhizobium sp. Leaf341 TaxID=1736344 RepID=UPI000714BCE3|nr:hypothetical protein [Rhizobium sp. Leaf341]KQR75753.1 hypothetical protein ASG03_18960 [Rhizobium sp. Leaf341]
MTYRSFIFLGSATLFAAICAPIAYLIYPAIELAMVVLRETPVAASFAIMAPVFAVVLFLVIGSLKPVYRDSYRTHGLSLAAR